MLSCAKHASARYSHEVTILDITSVNSLTHSLTHSLVPSFVFGRQPTERILAIHVSVANAARRGRGPEGERAD